MYFAIFFTLFVIASALAGLFVFLFIIKTKEFNEYFEEFKDVIDIKKETKKVEQELKDRRKRYEKFISECASRENELKSSYSQKKLIYDRLISEVSILEDRVDDLSYGLYTPHFEFDTPERYKIEIQKNREKQKALIRNKEAASCKQEWSVGGSKAEGKKMTDRTIKLMLRAFNNECDAAVLKVRWNNVQNMRERVTRAYEAINKLGEPVAIEVNPDYLELKLNEISLTHEYQEKLQAQKEEQRRIREQMREEEKVRQEIEKAIKESMQQEEAYNKALHKAKKELEHAHGAKVDELKEKIALLDKQLQEAIEKGKRAQSMAEKTKAGHVYIISNIGSFGEDIYKIGLTRRLEPTDRVKELGDASVPFAFDIHGMVYSENAPELENKFHKFFSDKQVNLVNPRKEFFSIPLNEIEEFAKENGLAIEFVKHAEAKEYRESISKRKAMDNSMIKPVEEMDIPASL